jgi:hypothetical protein
MTPTPTPTPDELGAASCSACDGCQWQHEEGRGNWWCYMFPSAPNQLPCTQHDKFEIERMAMSAMIRKCPAIIPMMVMGLSEPNSDYKHQISTKP